MSTILICDDERDIVSALEIYLKSEGYATISCYDGASAIRMVRDEEIHLVLLDIMMPGMDGLATLAEIRTFSNVPVIFLSAKSEDTDKILGLNLGADDYITKPFNPVELQARVRSHVRRYTMLGSLGRDDNRMLRVGGITLDDENREVTLDGDPVSLTPTEYEIFKLFMNHVGEIFSPREICRRVWKETPSGPEGRVAVHIRHLREKLEYDPSQPRYLKVIWGQGYVLENPERGQQCGEASSACNVQT